MKLLRLRRMLNKATGQSINAPVLIVHDNDQRELEIMDIAYIPEKGAIVILVRDQA